MHNINIRFDDVLFTTERKLKDDIPQGCKIGYYQKDNTCVLTTSYITGLPLVMSISKIANLLREATFSVADLGSYDIHKASKALNYLDFVHQIINKHNANLADLRENRIIKFLLTVPLINRFVQWYLKDIEQPLSSIRTLLISSTKHIYNLGGIPFTAKVRGFIEGLNEISSMKNEMRVLKRLTKVVSLQDAQSDLVRKYFNGTDYSTLKLQRDKLLDLIKEIRENPNNLEGEDRTIWNNSEIWGRAEKRVIESFETRLNQTMDVLKKSQHILKTSQEKPEDIIKESLNLTSENTFEEGYEAYNNLKELLVANPEFPSHLNEAIANAATIAKKAFGKWLLEKATRFPTKVEIVKNYLDAINFYGIKRGRDKFSDHLNKARQFHEELETPAEEKEVFNKLNSMLTEAYEEQLAIVVPAIKKAKEIVSCDPNDTNALISVTIDKQVSNLFNAAEHAYNTISTLLTSNPDYPTAHQDQIKQALVLVKKAYGEWMLLKAASINLDDVVRLHLLSQTYSEVSEEYVQFLDWVQKASKFHGELQTPADKSQVLDQLEIIAKEAFEVKIRQIIPALVEAERIIKAAKTNPNKMYIEILDLQEGDSLDKAYLPRPEILVTGNFNGEINAKIIEAQKLSKQAYVEWHAQRIIKYRQTVNPILGEVLGTTDSTKFLEKYQSFVTILKDFRSITPLAKQSLNALNELFENDLKKKLGPLARLELDANADVHLREVFERDLSYKELVKKKNEYLDLFSEWDKFQRAKFKEEVFVEIKLLSKSGKEVIQNLFSKEFAQRIPLYAQACNIINTFKPTQQLQSNVLLLNAPEDELAVSKTTYWYQNQLNLFESGILNLTEEDIPAEILDAIKETISMLHDKHARMEVIRLAERKVKLEETKKPKSKGFWAGVSSWWNSTNDAKAFLNVYADTLVKLIGLDSSEKLDKDQIDARYKRLMSTLEKSEATKDQRIELIEAYGSYERALKLQDILFLAFNISPIAFKFDEVFRGCTSFTERQERAEPLIQHLDTEIEIQKTREEGKVKALILTTLQKTKEQVAKHWEDYLIKEVPMYTKLKAILKGIPEPLKEGLYTNILNVDLSYTYTSHAKKVTDIYEKLSNELSGGNRDLLPSSIQEDLAKAEKWVLIAYKEWEADRMLKILESNGETVDSDKIKQNPNYKRDLLGLPASATETEINKRYRKLNMLLHPDRNRDVDELFKKKFETAVKGLFLINDDKRQSHVETAY